MKKILFLILLLIIIMAPAKGTYAYMATFTPPDADIDDLDHWRYYTWGIFSSIPPAEQEIISATLYIDKLNNWANESNILYIHLLDTDFDGLTSDIDNHLTPNDAFTGQGILLTTYTDTDGTYGREYSGVNWSYGFTASQLITLNQYASDNKFGFGFDPDCHFYNDEVRFEITTVPEPASMLLFGIGALGFGIVRRKGV